MLYNGQDHLASSVSAAAAAAAQFGLSRNLYHPLYPSPELAQLASWWPAAASLYNPLSSPHSFPFSTAAFSAANYNAQQAAAAAFSRFNPSFFLPPPSSSSSSTGNSQSENLQSSNNMSASHMRSSGNVGNTSNAQLFMQSSRISNNEQLNHVSSSPSINNSSHGQDHRSVNLCLIYKIIKLVFDILFNQNVYLNLIPNRLNIISGIKK